MVKVTPQIMGEEWPKENWFTVQGKSKWVSALYHIKGSFQTELKM